MIKGTTIEVGQKYFINDPLEMGLEEDYSHGDIVEIGDIGENGFGWFNRDCYIIPHWIKQGYAQLVEDAPQNNNERKNQYIRTITNRHTGESIEADIYDVLAAYNVTCPCMAHGIKKAMVPGERHSKSVWKDKKEAAWSIEESILLQGDKPDVK